MNPPLERPAPRIYSPAHLDVGASIELDQSASRHVAGALRLQPGARLVLFNGEGGEYTAEIEHLERRVVRVRITGHEAVEREAPLPIQLGLAVSRGDRMDYAIQKSTELGVAAIHPLLTERTEVKLSAERREKKVQHWQQVAVSACEQCGRNQPPRVHEISALAAWLPAASGDYKFVLHHHSERGLAGLARPAGVCLLIGPEGGLSPGEIDAATDSGFQALRLGPRVLRTETAPLAALSILQFHWGDLQ
jgi:16S rRNA (uracil1498-N3)-methyltransferase